MSYKKQEFASGQKLYASQLNAMDEQIAANETAIGEKVSADQLSAAVNEAIGSALTGVVSFRENQELTAEQQLLARNNIGAANAQTVEALDGVMNGKSYTELHEETVQVTAGSSINTRFFDVDIKAGESYTISIQMLGEDLFPASGPMAYEGPADGSADVTIGVIKESINWKITRTASTDVHDFKLYLAKEGVKNSGTMKLMLTIPRVGGASLVDKVEQLEEKSRERTITNNHIRLFTDKVIRGTDGVAADYAGWISTDYVDLTGREGDTVTLNAKLYSSFGVAFYDNQYRFLSGVNGTNAADYGYTEKSSPQNVTLPIPEGCCYLRATMGTGNYGPNKKFDITFSSLEKAPEDDVPGYFHEGCYFENKYNRIHQLMKKSMANGDAFVFITDEHWEVNQGNSIGLIRCLSDYLSIPRLFSGGDTGDFGSEKFCRLLRENFRGEIHHVVGNHDYFKRDNQGATLFAMMDMGKENQVGNPGRHYYYVDNRQQKLRYVILSAFDHNPEGTTSAAKNGYEEEQLQWLQNTALAVGADWTVIVFTHSLIPGTVETVDNAVTQIIDACNENNNIAAILQGHTHYDWIAQTAGGIPIVSTTCDKNYVAEGVDDYIRGRDNGTILEQAFDVCVLDKNDRTLTMVRIGCPVREGTEETDWTLSQERVISY